MKLELFHKMGCPFSAKVRDYIDAQGIKSQITYRDIEEDSSNHEQLMQLTGDHQVPCLVIDGKPLLESDDIISWLGENVSAQGATKAAS